MRYNIILDVPSRASTSEILHYKGTQLLVLENGVQISSTKVSLLIPIRS